MKLSLALLLALFALSGCASSKKENAKDYDEMRLASYKNAGPSKRYDNEGHTIRPYDMNGDRVIDMWKIFVTEKTHSDDIQTTTRLIRKEVDSNFDGLVDIWLYYNIHENLIKEEIDSAFQGNVDRVFYYDKGVLVKTESYTIENNREKMEDLGDASHRKPNITKTFKNGVLVRVENDFEADGIIDEWEIFDSSGNLVQIGLDHNKDGKVDDWKRFGAMDAETK